MQKEDWGFYFHIPFCEHRCSYCDFFTTAGYETDKIAHYMSYLSREVELFSRVIDRRCVNVRSIYFGGGTPSFVPAEQLAALLSKIRVEFDVAADIEITVEANPESAIGETLYTYREAGINRLSIGVQSLNLQELRILERIHDIDDSFKTVEIARTAGFENIGIDLLYGIPGQTIHSWEGTLKGIPVLQPEHISAYALMLERGTRMIKLVHGGTLHLPEDDQIAEMYEIGCLFLKKLGYEHYEVSSYAREGCISRHNSHYWQRKPYRGFGMSAHSYNNTIRSWNTTDFISYFNRIDHKELPVAGTERITLLQHMNEEIMLRLRMSMGLSLTNFTQQFGGHNANLLREKINEMTNDGNASRYFQWNNKTVRLTAAGFFVSDEIISQLLFSEEDSKKLWRE